MMANQLEKQMQEILIASLPEQTAGMMKKFVEEANLLKDKCEKQEQTIERQTIREKDLQANFSALEQNYENLIAQKEEVASKALELNKKEKVLLDREIKLDLTIANIEKVAAQDLCKNYVGFLATLVKNPVSERWFNESKSVPGGYTANRDGTTTYQNAGNIEHHIQDKTQITK